MKKIFVALMILTSIFYAPSKVETAHAGGTCPAYERLLVVYGPKGGWSVPRMSGLMWRESRCTPQVRSRTRDTGLLQINDINLPFLSKAFGYKVTSAMLKNPIMNIKAAAKICEVARKWYGNCYQPWTLRR